MSIKFACSCGKAYKVPDKFSGKRIKCKKCGEPIRVPSESESGVQSQRASAVSKRSVLASERISSKSSRKSGRTSARVSSKRLAKASSKSGRSSSAGRTSQRRKRAGSGTARFTPLDLIEGNAMKRFKKKREGDEFERGEGRLTYFENGKPRKAYKVGRKRSFASTAASGPDHPPAPRFGLTLGLPSCILRVSLTRSRRCTMAVVALVSTSPRSLLAVA